MDRLVALAMNRAPRKVGGSDAQLAQRLLKAIAENDKSVTSVEIGASGLPSGEGGASSLGDNTTAAAAAADSAVDANGNLVSSSYLDSTLACGLVRAIEDNRYVNTLTIKGRDDPSELIPAVASLLHHSHALSYIRLADMHIGDDLGLVLMGSLAKNLSITTAVLTNLGFTNTDGISMLLKHNDVLTSVDFSYNDFGGEGDEPFAELAESLRFVGSTKLTELRFAHTNLSDASLNRICCVLEESLDFCPALNMFDFGSGEGEGDADAATEDQQEVATSIGTGNTRYTILEYTRQRLVTVLNKRREGSKRTRRIFPREGDLEMATDGRRSLATNGGGSAQLEELLEEVEQGKRNVAEMQKSLDAAHSETLVWKKKQQTAVKEKDDAVRKANESRVQASEATSFAEGLGVETTKSLAESAKEVQDAYGLVNSLKDQLEEVTNAFSRLRVEYSAVEAERNALGAENVALRDQYCRELQEAILKISAISTEPSQGSGDVDGFKSSSMSPKIDVGIQTDMQVATASSARDRKLSTIAGRRSSAEASPTAGGAGPLRRIQSSGFGTTKFTAYVDGDDERRKVSTNGSFEHVDGSGLVTHYASASQAEKDSPKWKEDKFAPNCALCQKEFKLLVRKHHCRRCGDVYCDRCCSKSKLHDNERICSQCASAPLQLSDF